MSAIPWITILTFAPLAGATAIMGMSGRRQNVARWLGLGFSLVSLALALVLVGGFNPASGRMQFEESCNWIPTLNVWYHVGVDGLGLVMVLLTAIVVPMALLASWKISDRVPLFFALVLALQAGLFGTFTALNFFHWFLFWELSLVPAFFLIKLWGGPERGAAASQFFIYTMVGSITLLLAFLAIFLCTHEFEFSRLADLGQNGSLIAALSEHLGWRDLTTRKLAAVIFGGAFLGFAVKVPLVPFHTWVPSAYSEAPTGVTMLLTGLMSKMGVYGFLRILLPIFPTQMAWLYKPLLALAVVTIVYSAAAAFAQRDLKRLLAYSSINHLGYCLLGAFAVAHARPFLQSPALERSAALDGVILQMFNHGLTAATLFWFVGMLEARSGGLRGLDDFGGVRKVAPVFAGLMGMALFSSLGLPGLNGFVGEFLIFKGVFALAPWAAAAALPGLLVTAVFLLTLFQRVFNGPLNRPRFSDLTLIETITLAPAIGMMFVLGLCPQLLLQFITRTATQLAQRIAP